MVLGLLFCDACLCVFPNRLQRPSFGLCSLWSVVEYGQKHSTNIHGLADSYAAFIARVISGREIMARDGKDRQGV